LSDLIQDTNPSRFRRQMPQFVGQYWNQLRHAGRETVAARVILESTLMYSVGICDASERIRPSQMRACANRALWHNRNR
jgi:hypothetical protein